MASPTGAPITGATTANGRWHAAAARPLRRSGGFSPARVMFPTRPSPPGPWAEETLRLAMAAGGWTCPARSAEALYGGGVSGLLAEIHKEPAATHVLLAVGHEPTWSEAAALLVGGGRLRLPTGAVARIDLEVDRWEEVGPGTGVLAWSVVPRLLAE